MQQVVALIMKLALLMQQVVALIMELVQLIRSVTAILQAVAIFEPQATLPLFIAPLLVAVRDA